MNTYTLCDDVELYALDGLEDAERRHFEEHLAQCSECQFRLKDLRDITEELLYLPEDVTPPQGMRDRVLAAVTELPQANVENVQNESPAPTPPPVQLVTPIIVHRRTWQQRLFPYISAAAVVVIGLLGWQVNALQQQNSAQSQEIEHLGKLVATASLSPAGQEYQKVGGQAMLLTEGPQKIVMIKASNLPKPTDRQQYTLWVMNHGKTQVINGGTFLPSGENGIGMIMFPVQMQDFDTVAISLEPDAYSGNTPRGVPVMSAHFTL